jgi:hypothetical protein
LPTQILTPSDVAGVAARLVGTDLNLARLISTDYAADFAGHRGSTVNVRVPGAVAASTKDARDTTTPLVASPIVEQSIPVTLNTLAYSNVPLAPGHYDLDIESFAAQILRPQADALVEYVEAEIADALQATPETTAITYAAATPAKTFTAIRRTLRQNGVPAGTKLTAVVGANVYADLLDADAEVGSDQILRVRGFEIHESTRLAADEIVGFVPAAFSLVVRAPEPPAGAPFSASVRTDAVAGPDRATSGFAVTHIRAFDTSTGVDRSIVQALVAVAAMPLPVRVDDAIELVANAGAVRVLTAS